MEFLIGGVLIGLTMALTIYNTVKLHRKEPAAADTMSEEQKRREEEFEALMNYRGKE